MTALELYKSLETEFTMGSPKSKLNRMCKNSEDLIIYAMKEYAKLKVKETKIRMNNAPPPNYT